MVPHSLNIASSDGGSQVLWDRWLLPRRHTILPAPRLTCLHSSTPRHEGASVGTPKSYHQRSAIKAPVYAYNYFGGYGMYLRYSDSYEIEVPATPRLSAAPTVLTVDQEKSIAEVAGSERSECAVACPLMVVVPAGK